MKLLNVIVLLLVLACGIAALVILMNNANYGYAISTTYRYTEQGKGIVPAPPADLEHPTIPYLQLLSTRFPAFVLLDSVGLYDMGKCKGDLIWKAHIPTPKDRFSCYNTPLGQYVQPRPFDPWGREKFRGNLFCYSNTAGGESQGIDSEAAVRQKILDVLVDNPQKEVSWTKVMAVNSLGDIRDIPVCA